MSRTHSATSSVIDMPYKEKGCSEVVGNCSSKHHSEWRAGRNIRIKSHSWDSPAGQWFIDLYTIRLIRETNHCE